MFARANGDRENIDNALLIVTDGSSNNNRLTLQEAGLAKKDQITIFVAAKGKLTSQCEG